VLHRCCADDAAESGWTSWDALPAAGHVHSAAVSSTPRPHPAAVTRWRTTPTGAYDRPTQRSPYSTLRPEVAVQRGDMHVPGGHREQRRQRTQRDARNRGAVVVVVVVSRCSKSLAAPSYMPSTTSDSGRKTTHALVIYKGENVRVCNKAGGRSRRGKRPGEVSLPTLRAFV